MAASTASSAMLRCTTQPGAGIERCPRPARTAQRYSRFSPSRHTCTRVSTGRESGEKAVERAEQAVSAPCVERTETEAYRNVAMAYFEQVGSKEPCLKHVMVDGCVMTDRVLGWCFRGREAVEAHFRDFADTYCAHEFSHLDVLTNLEGRTVCAHWALTLQPKTDGDDGPCPADVLHSTMARPRPQVNTISGVHLFTLNADNKIADIVTFRTACNADQQFDY